jgi:anti-sigma B factor antagonist
MEINIKPMDPATVVEIVGDIDGKTAPQAQEQILPLLQSGARVLLNMSQVGYMSSAGLRIMLSTHRQATANKAQVALVGLSEDIQETMSATGFLSFFTLYDTVEAGLEGMK